MDFLFFQRLALAAVAVVGLRWVLGTRALPVNQMTPVERLLAAALGISIFLLVFADERYLVAIGALIVLTTAALRYLLGRP